MKNYTVISYYKLGELKNTVKRLMKEGWVPEGGVEVILEGNNYLFYQTMIKNKDISPIIDYHRIRNIEDRLKAVESEVLLEKTLFQSILDYLKDIKNSIKNK